MKKTSCFLLLAVWGGLGLAPLFAQTSFGLHSGLNYGTARYSNLLPQVEEKNTVRELFGISYRWQLKNRFALGLDAQFGVKASRVGLKGQPSALDTRHQNSYLELAPRAEYFFTKNFGVSLGFYTAYLVKQMVKYGDDGPWLGVRKDFYSNRWDTGLTPGIALQFKRVFGFLRYAHSLVALDKIEFTDDQGQSLGNTHRFNRYFQAGIGYVIFE